MSSFLTSVTNFYPNGKMSTKRNSLTGMSNSHSSYFYNQCSYHDNIAKIKKEKNIMRSDLKNAKQIQIKLIDNYHKYSLRDSFINNPKNCNFFMNKSESMMNIRSADSYIENNKKSFKNSIINSGINLPINLSIDNYSNNFYETFEFPKLIETMPEFLVKSKKIRLEILKKGIKIEEYLNLEEEYLNEFEECREKIISSKMAKELLKSYEDKFFIYLKNLNIELLLERTELEKLMTIKGRLDIEISKLKMKIYFMKRELDKFAEIRNFLICVKERRVELPNAFYLFVEEFEGVKEEVLKNIHNDKTNNRNKKEIKRKTGNCELNDYRLNQFRNEEMEKLMNYVKTNQIFSSADDFVEYFECLEKENLKLISSYDHLTSTANRIKLEIEKIKIHKNLKENKLTKELLIKENQLRKLKMINKNLNIEKENIILNSNDINSLEISKGFNYGKKLTGVYYKLLEIIKYFKSQIECLKFPEYKLYSHGDITNEKNLLMLKEIEKGIDFLLDRYKYYKDKEENDIFTIRKNEDGPIINLSYVENNMEKERKINLAKDTKIIYEIKREELREKVFKKFNKFYILPRRKGDVRFKPKEKINKVTLENINPYAEFEELIKYDETDY